MERDSYNENFERFLRSNADNYRMPASEKVWKNISKELSRRRRWIGFTLSVILVLTAVGGYYLVNNSVKPLPHTTVQQKQSPATTENVLSIQKPVNSENLNATVNVQDHSDVNAITTRHSGDNLRRKDLSVVVGNPVIIPGENNSNTESAIVNNNFNSPIVDSYEDGTEKKDLSHLNYLKQTNAEQYPLSIESVANAYKGKEKKFSLQVSFSPTVSYRKLSENKSYTHSVSSINSSPNMAPLYSVNDAVTQKPNMGLELGVMGKYRVSKNVKLIGGLQFNMSRYDIKAFTAPYTFATFRLTTSSGLDSVRTLTPLSNTGGYESNWLTNTYLQVSAPVGVEVKLAGDNKTHFGFATTIQPTYVIGDMAYLITSDYQSYAQVPWLTRHWNVNANLQTFVSYSTGKMRWQVGPQVRYQLLSSFVSKYPVKENLFDFGLRVGISLNKQ